MRSIVIEFFRYNFTNKQISIMSDLSIKLEYFILSKAIYLLLL